MGQGGADVGNEEEENGEKMEEGKMTGHGGDGGRKLVGLKDGCGR